LSKVISNRFGRPQVFPILASTICPILITFWKKQDFKIVKLKLAEIQIYVNTKNQNATFSLKYNHLSMTLIVKIVKNRTMDLSTLSWICSCLILKIKEIWLMQFSLLNKEGWSIIARRITILNHVWLRVEIINKN